MRKYLLTLFILVLVVEAMIGQAISLPPSGDNQKASVTQHIGLVTVTVDYSSPDVTGPNGEDRNGKIWGQLVPYGLTDLGFGLRTPGPWRAGANESTTIRFSNDVVVEGKPLKAGTYGLFLITQETGPWTWIFSKNSTAWGAFFYQEKDDALRVQVTPQEHAHTEWLTYNFTDRDPKETTLELQWEQKSIPMRIAVPDLNDLYIAQIDRELENSPGFTSTNYAAAANFLLQENYKLEKALEWANASIDLPFTGQKSFTNITTKANVLLKMGRKDEAMSSFESAMKLSDAAPGTVHQLGRGLLGQGEKEMALKVFQMNYDNAKGEWPTNVGMLRGLSAVGRYDDALKYAQAALAQAPDDVNKKNINGMIEKLKNKQDVN
ncbi:MAG TPA: DUF2911 domain-containing protein [Saprospiraceae bacterium]|nr:DUF2911 domain-containing protein [Saprospiraceae bacterium]